MCPGHHWMSAFSVRTLEIYWTNYEIEEELQPILSLLGLGAVQCNLLARTQSFITFHPSLFLIQFSIHLFLENFVLSVSDEWVFRFDF